MRRDLLLASGALALAALGWLGWHWVWQPVQPSEPAIEQKHVTVLSDSSEPPNVATFTIPMAAVVATAARTGALSQSLSEAEMMDHLRATLGKGMPKLTLDIARDLARVYPDGVQSEERSLYAIDALIALNRITEMRDEARRHLEKWPGTPTSARVMARTGVHPELRRPPGAQSGN